MSRRRAVQTAFSAALLPAPALESNRILARAQAPAEPEVAGLNYHPRGMFVWDSWYFVHQGDVHVIHLQKPRPGSERPEVDGRALGHAVSRNLLTWEELPPALSPGPEGDVDDLDLFTGCIITRESTHFLFYTARKRAEDGHVQRLCVATSTDALTWTRHGSPVIEPDPRWYEQGDCRDLMVVLDPDTQIYHGFFTARVPSPELSESAVVAHATSRDLIHWEQGPPVFAPGAFGILEEPDVFFLENRWWIICATGNFDGVRGEYRDRSIIYGTIYASSSRIDGPYVLGAETLLLGGTQFNGFSCRTVVWQNRRYAMYTQAERQGHEDGLRSTLGCLSTPKQVTVVGDRLCLAYSPLLEQRIGKPLLGRGAPLALEKVTSAMADRRFGTRGHWRQVGTEIWAESPRSWSVRRCGTGAAGFILKAQLMLESGRSAGLLCRGSLAVLLDLDAQRVTACDLPEFQPIESRAMHLTPRRPYALRIVAKGEFFEVYVDNVLVLNFVRYRPADGRFGLFVEQARATFQEVEAVSLNI